MTLWVKWVHTFVIKSQNMRHMATPIDSSRTIRKLFKLREVGQLVIRHILGDGSGTFLWLDNWHPLGPFIKGPLV